MQNIYLFHGDDSYTSIQKAIFWQQEFEKKFGDLNSETLEGETLTASAFSEAVNTMPFLSEKKFVVVKNAFADAPTEELKNIAEKIEQTPDHCVVVFVERKKADSRTILFKTLKKNGQVMEFSAMDIPELTTWIEKEFQKKGSSTTPGTTAYLAETVGPNLWQMSHEIEKLSLNADGRQINKNDVDEQTSPNLETTVFKLVDNIGQKRTRESLRNLKTLIDMGTALIPTIFMVVRHFRILIQIKDCLDRNMRPPAIAKQLKLHPFVVNKSITQCKNFSHETLKSIYRRLLRIDTAMKTGKIKMTTEDQTELRLSLEKLICEVGR